MPNQPDLDPTVVIPLPQRTLAAFDALENAGFETWIVGGYVRDALLGRPSSDIDIATQAHWQDVQRVFEGQGYRTHETGTAHGTLTVIVDEQALEVTTYRSDGAYADARHPNQVSFVRTIAEDLARRDFTMNALAYHPARGLFDPYGGHADLEARIIRAVGDPDRRFSEDALRMLRACRFAAELGFAIDPNTFEGMLANKGLLPRISTQRITHELQRLLLGEHAGRALTATVDVLAAVLPDGVPPYPLVRWAALFHDMGKPAAFFTDEDGTGHFYGHAAISVMLARGIMGRLALSSAFSAQVLTLVERHDDVIDRTPKAVKRALSRLGGNVELFAALCDLKRGDARGQAPRCIDRVSDADELERILSEILAADEAFSLKKLAIDGRDVIELGVPQGPLVGLALSDALDAVMDERIDNEACALRAFIEGWRAEHEDRAPL